MQTKEESLKRLHKKLWPRNLMIVEECLEDGMSDDETDEVLELNSMEDDTSHSD